MPRFYQSPEFQPDVKSNDIYVGSVIRQSRMSANLTRAQLSELVALCPNQIRNYEIGKSSIRLNVLTRFDRFLNLRNSYWMQKYCHSYITLDVSFLENIGCTNNSYVYIDDCDRYFGHNIRLARRQLGVRPCLLASKLRVSHQQLNKYENGLNSIDLYRYVLLCSILKINPIELYKHYAGNAF